MTDMTNLQNDLAPQAPVPQPPPQAATDQPALSSAPDLNSLLADLNFGLPLPAAPSQEPPLAPDPSAESALPALQFSAAPLQSLPPRPAAKPRNGKIAHLPQLEREMVNRMLHNNLPHRTIVAALEECGFQATERNVSNWKTRGGYNEWRAAQQRALELRTFQDNLTAFLRRHDATELPEVGLQSAATSLSAILLRPDLMRELISDPQKYSKLIEIQCRLAREIQALQQNRDDATKSLGRNYNPERLKRQNAQEVERIREALSSKSGKSTREANVPHRNFIPTELEPVAPTPAPLTLAQLLQLKTASVGRPSAGSPPPKVAS